MVMPRDAWVDKLELHGWHAKFNARSKLTLAKELVRAVQLRNLLAVPQSLPSQDIPFRQPVITPVTEEEGLHQAQELERAGLERDSQIVQTSRSHGLTAIERVSDAVRRMMT